MLIALFVAFLVVKIVGGPEEVFMIPKLEKEIKSHVEGKDRKKEILIIFKEGKKDLKSFTKLRKKKLKEIEKMSASRANSMEEIFSVYETLYNARLDYQSRLTDKRLEIQNLLNDKEWEQIIEKAVLPSDKLKQKEIKQEGKKNKDVDKLLGNIEESIIEHIGDEQKRKEILLGLENFRTTLEVFVEEGRQMNFADNDIIRNKNASRKNIEQFYKTQNQLRYKGSKEFFEMRNIILQNTNEREWKEIIKSINKIIDS